MAKRIRIGDIGEAAVIEQLTAPTLRYHACTLPYYGRNGIDVIAWRRGKGGENPWKKKPDRIRFIEVKSTATTFERGHEPTLSAYQKKGGYSFVADRLTAALHYAKQKPERHGTTEIIECYGTACTGNRVKEVSRREFVEVMMAWMNEAWFEEAEGKRQRRLNQAEIDELFAASASGQNIDDLDTYKEDKRSIRATFEIATVEDVNISDASCGAITTGIDWVKA